MSKARPIHPGLRNKKSWFYEIKILQEIRVRSTKGFPVLQKSRVFEQCHFADFSDHAGRDNTIRKVKQRYYWQGHS